MASTSTDPRVLVVLDFDGTMAVDDVGNELIRTFGEFDVLNKQLLDGEITAAEDYRRAVASFTQDCTPDAIERFAMEREVDPGLHDLLDLCDRQGARILVASDGFDVYIKTILKREGLGRLELHSNRLTWDADHWVPSFPLATESCTCFCASCKRNAVLDRLGEDTILVYVGDGLSDQCAAKHADIIFAKRRLAAWCTEQRIPHHPFKTMFDVRRILASRFATGDLKPRRQALLARKAAFTTE